ADDRDFRLLAPPVLDTRRRIALGRLVTLPRWQTRGRRQGGRALWLAPIRWRGRRRKRHDRHAGLLLARRRLWGQPLRSCPARVVVVAPAACPGWIEVARRRRWARRRRAGRIDRAAALSRLDRRVHLHPGAGGGI